MRTRLLEQLRCPRLSEPACRDTPLSVDVTPAPGWREDGAELIEGLLACAGCGARYPVLAGVAVLLDEVAHWVRANYLYLAEGAASAGGIGAPMRAWLEDRGWHLSNRPADNYYESPRWTNLFTSTHYDGGGVADDDHALARFLAARPQVFEVITDALRGHGPEAVGRALDVGTNVGGMAWRCADLAREVIGIDNAFNPVLTARRIQRGYPDPLRSHRRYDDGRCYRERALPAGPPNTEFIVASVYRLPVAGSFDLITALNVIDVVPEPLGFLRIVHERLAVGGLLALTSPYSWGSDDVPLDRWIGGSAETTSPHAVVHALRDLGFRVVVEHDDVPWVVREHRRWYRVFLNHCVIARKEVP